MALAFRPQVDLALVLSAQNPQIDLKLDAYEQSTRAFINLLSNYAKNSVAAIADDTKAFNAEKTRIQEKIQHVQAETNHCKTKEIELLEVLKGEQEERKEAESSVAALKRQLVSIREKCASIDVEIEQYKSMVSNLRREKERESALLDSHALQVSQHLWACEQTLHGIIEGIAKDKILVRFSHIDKSDLDREFSFVIDVSNRLYKVPTSTPFLPTLPILVDKLNQSRDIYDFLKQTRKAFEDLLQHR